MDCVAAPHSSCWPQDFLRGTKGPKGSTCHVDLVFLKHWNVVIQGQNEEDVTVTSWALNPV